MPLSAQHDRPADVVLTGGHVFTADPARPRAEAVAVRDGRIVAVGTAGQVEAYVGQATRRIDLADRLLIPGFQDAHIHSLGAGMIAFRVDLHDGDTIAEYQSTTRAWAEGHPDSPWVTGEGWSMDVFPGGNPRREDLDAVVADRPATLWSRDGHTVWANSRALELAGITAGSPDPPGGRVIRDPDGTPAGALHEAATRLVTALEPPETAEEREQGILNAQALLHAFGLTAWQEVNVRPAELDAWLAVAGRGSRGSAGGLSARVVAGLRLDRELGAAAYDQLVEARDRSTVGRFRATHVKLFQDGIIESFTAAMVDPYLDAEGRPTANRGDSVVPAAQLREEMVKLDALGFNVHVHALGDRAVRETLDAIEAARRANGPNDLRHQLAHIQVVHPADLPRFAAVGAIANGQPYWACRESQMELLTVPFLGEPRWTWQYPFRSLLDAGARLAFGSDWAVSTPNPLLEIEVAVNRVSDRSRDREPFLPDERLDLATAITAFTAGSAFANGLEADTGTIEVGKAADLTLLDRDLFAADAGPIGDARVLLTLVDGQAVFEAPALDD